MPLMIVGNPKTRIGYTVRHFTSEELAASDPASEFLVPYDHAEPSHTAFRPHDVHDGAGKFSTPPISEEHRERAHLALDEHALTLAARASAETSEHAERSRLGLRKPTETPHADALARFQARHQKSRAEIDAAKTVHDLPDEIRVTVRGCRDAWMPHPDEIAKHEAELAAEAARAAVG
jgi:hypothetical protein